MAGLRRFEFGICGIDRSVPVETLQDLLSAEKQRQDEVQGVRVVVAFQLAYQGFPWQPAPEYEKDAPLEKRRYGGLTYMAWDEIESLRASLPDSTAYSFHLNQTSGCPYVSDLLKGTPESRQLVDTLVKSFKAHHIQINLSAFGVPRELFMPQLGGDASHGINIIHQLCEQYPTTTFIVPFTKRQDKAGVETDTSQFIKLLFERQPVPANLCVLFDNSAGTGVEPDAAPNIPDFYPQNKNQFIGFTGGIGAANAKKWLARYDERAREHGCSLLSDAQSRFRQEHDRGKPIDEKELCELVRMVREWPLGVYVSGPLPLEALEVQVIDGVREYTEAVVQGADDHWAKCTQLNPKLFNGDVWTVASHAFDSSSSKLMVKMQKSSFKYVLYTHYSEPGHQLPFADRAGAAGLMALTETSDGFFVYGKRSEKVAAMPGHWHCVPAGNVDSSDFKVVLEKELREEVGASFNDADKVQFFAFMDDGAEQGHKYEFVFHVRLKLAAFEVHDLHSKAEDKYEHAELKFVRAPWNVEPAAAPSDVPVIELEDFVRNYPLTDVSRRALLLAQKLFGFGQAPQVLPTGQYNSCLLL